MSTGKTTKHFNHGCSEFILGNILTLLPLLNVGTCGWKPYPGRQPFIVHDKMATCVLLLQGARASAGTALTLFSHDDDVKMSAMASQITSLTIACSTVYSGTDDRKHQNSASLAFVRGIHRRPVNSPHKGPVTRKMFPSDDITMKHLWTTWPLDAIFPGVFPVSR